MLTGDDYFDSNEFRDLLKSYEESVRSGVPIFFDTDDLTDIADYYKLIGNNESANKAIENALEIDSGAVLPLIFKIRQALQNYDIKSAKRYFCQITDKDNPDYKFIKAEIFLYQNQIDEADKYLQDYFKEIPNEDNEDFIIDIANLYLEYNQNNKALKWLHLSNRQQDIVIKELTARALFGLGKYKECESLFNELLDINPYSQKYWNALSCTQFMLEDYNGSLTSSEYAIAINPNEGESVLSKANVLFKLENYKEALNYYKRYSEIEPNDEFGELNIGTCLINQGKYTDAIEHLKKSELIASPDSHYLIQIYKELAFALSALKHTEEALSYINKIEVLENQELNHDFSILKGHIYLENGLREEAQEVFKNVIISSDHSPYVILRVIVSLYDNKYVNTAYTLFKDIYEPSCKNIQEGYSYMTLCCWDLKKWDECLHYLNLAIKVNPNEAKKVLIDLVPNDFNTSEYLIHIKSLIDRFKNQDNDVN